MPGVDGTFIEVETTATDEDGMRTMLDELHTMFVDLHISSEVLMTELYTDAVAKARA